MYRGDQCDDSLACSYISLEESCHRMGMFHVLQYLEEDDLLLISQGKWKISDDRLHEFYIEGNSGCESFTFCYSSILLLDATKLELEEFAITELSFCSFEILDRFREVDISNTHGF